MTAGCVLIAAPTALYHLGRRANASFGELELDHHALTVMSVHAIDPVASDGSLHLHYEGAEGVTLSDDPQLLATNLVRSDGSPALTGQYLVDRMPQPNLPSVEEQFVTSGRQVVPLVGVADLELSDTLGVAYAPSPPSGLPEVSSVSAVAASPLAAPASPSPSLLARLSPEERASLLLVWSRFPLYL